MRKTLITLFSLVGCIGGVNAAEYIWTNGTGDGKWSTSGNWDLNNSYYPQSQSDTAIIQGGHNVVWSSEDTGDYFGDIAAIRIGDNSSVLYEANSTAKDIKVGVFTLGGGALFKMTGTNAIGYDKDFTIDYGTFTADSHGFFDANMGGGTLWTNAKTITLTGSFDTTGLVGSGSITLYDASAITIGGGAAVFDVSGISLAKSDNIDVDIVTAGNKVVINYAVTPATPEPSAAMLSLLAMVGLAARRRRK